jgi:group I intron endonuclease
MEDRKPPPTEFKFTTNHRQTADCPDYSYDRNSFKHTAFLRIKTKMANTNKYSRGKIYKLVNDIDDECYVGSTCDTLAKRKGGHKVMARKKPNQRVYAHLNQVGWANVKIVLIENYACNNVEELNARERFWFDELKPSLNKQVPSRSVQEWREANKHYITQRLNLEHNKVKKAQCDKKYRDSKKDEINQKKQQRRNENITIIKCECGSEVKELGKNGAFKKHLSCKKHQEWLANQPSTSS